ncbi:Gfo/Idh/MocA family protein [Luteimonas kalidii]|uniref:Gfo/Idh/MocA family oxidoreductase n=1 Tax=Luteimonas kalidii TaxID=3042025 RepID=A0ABT6JSP3_9GAMM|nr:Gfo/Idh/MocA family oxidoreductase [Luteimonas kalidii]MDH5833001.1 Gfo/Idh/MocA family oxidoreductase [Luteimonas kalidii]
MTVRWGILGCGDVTEVKSGPALQQATGSALVAVMRRDGRKAEDYARRHGVPRWYDDADALIADPGVDAVYVATPPSSHATLAIRALQAGKPVYVEKPMARDSAECEAMLAAGHAAGQPLFVAFYRRALPRFLKVRALLEAGAIGMPREVRIVLHRTLDPRYASGGALPWRVRPEIAGGGLFVDLGSHTLDLLDFLFGPVTQVSGSARSVSGAYPAEDTVEAALTFANGAQGTGDWNFCSDARRDLVEITGDRGRLRFASFDEVPVELESDAGRERFEIAHPLHIQQPLLETVMAALRGEGDCPSTGVTAARTTAVIDAILHGFRNAASGVGDRNGGPLR